jgi:hypothetical protein
MRTNEERLEAKIKAKTDATLRETKAEIRTNQEKMEASQEEMKAKTGSHLLREPLGTNGLKEGAVRTVGE